MENVLFVSGIDTGIGKTVVTGFLAKKLMSDGFNVITQKLVQTGCIDVSEDIQMHRKIMGVGMTEDDIDNVTCPYIFTYPASPHLASEIDNRSICFDVIDDATGVLSEKYDFVLLEGAGGLMVPLKRNYYTIDFIKERNYPLILVTSGRLGSINHTILSLQACKYRGINLHSVVYNFYMDDDNLISRDSIGLISDYVKLNFPDAKFEFMDKIDVD